MAEEEVGLRTTLKDRRQTAAGLRDIEGGLDRVGSSASRAGSRARSGAGGFEAMRRSGRLAAVGIRAGFAVALGAGYAAVRLLKSSFGQASESLKVGRLTQAAIKSTGGAANVSARQVNNLSNRLSQMAGIDDELIQSGGNVLLTFKNIRNEMGKNNKIFNQATKASIDLSTTPLLNGNITSASKMLGKALNDPILGLASLGRAGVQFTAGQKDQIKSMVEQNNLLGAQKVILHEVNSEVGGAAKSQATWADRATVAFQNVEEQLGKGLWPLLNQLSKWFVNEGAKDLRGYVRTFITEGVPALKKFARQATPLVKEVLPELGDVLGTVRDVLGQAAPYAVQMVEAFNNMPSWAKKAVVTGGLVGYAGAKTGAFSGLSSLVGSRGGGGLTGMIASAKPVPVFVTNEGFGGGGVPGVTGTVAAGERGLLSKAALGASVVLKQVAAAAAVTLAIKYLNEHLAPKATQPAVQAGSGGTGAVPGGLDQAFPDQNPVNSALESIKGFVTGGGGGTPILAQLSAQLSQTTSLSTLLGTGLNHIAKTPVNPKFSTPGLDQANSRTGDYKGLLGQVSKPVTTKVFANTSSATNSVNSLAEHIRAVLSSAATTVSVALAGVTGHHRAGGGPVSAGVPYVVGERRPELFVPKVDGYILPTVPNRSAAGGLGDVDFDHTDVPAAATHRTTVVQLVLPDGRVIAETVLEGFETIGARR